MADFYLDTEAGSDGVGTEADPFNLLSSLQSALDGTGNNGLATGSTRGETLTLDGFSGFLAPWGAPLFMRGDTEIAGTWTNSTGAEWTINIGAGLDVAGVVEDWDTNINGDGRHEAHFVPGTPASLAAREFDYDAGTGVLTIRASDSSDPNTSGKVYGWCKGGNAIDVSDSTGAISGITPQVWVSGASAEGYGVRASGCSGMILFGIDCTDMGFHGLGFVDTPNSDNIIDSCTVRGGRDGGSLYVFAVTNGVSEDMAGNRCRNCVADAYILLQPGGAAVESGGIVAFLAHGADNGGGNIQSITPAGMIFEGCSATSADQESDSVVAVAFQANSPCDDPTDVLDYRTYPTQFIDCTCVTTMGLGTNNATGEVNVALHRCHIDTRQYYSAAGTTNNALSEDGDTLFDACVLVGFSDSAQDAITRLAGSNACIVSLINCIVHNTDPNTGTAHMHIFSQSGSVNHTLNIYGNIFSYDTAANTSGRSLLRNWEGTINAGGNLYFNIGDDFYNHLGPAGANSESEWQSGVDLTGVYDQDPGYNDAANGDLEGAAGSFMRVTQLVNDTHTDRGINDRDYDGRLGPYQYGSAFPRRRRRTMARAGRRLRR